MSGSIFTDDFTTTPYWWVESPLEGDEDAEVSFPDVEFLVIGAGYAGLSCALTLSEGGREVLVLDADRPGWGASTRSGGQVTGGVNVGKAPTGVKWADREAALLSEASEGYRLFEKLLAKYRIECGYHKTGRLTVAWTPNHLTAWSKRVEPLNRLTNAGIRVLAPEELRDEIGSDYYFGGLLMTEAGHIHPAKYLAGLLRAARRAGVRVRGGTAALKIERADGGFRVATSRGKVRARQLIVASNGYTGTFAPNLRRRVIPVRTHMIATERLDLGLARSLIPRNRAVAETRRVVNHFRLSPDGSRLLFGGRARFTEISDRAAGEILRGLMIARFPQLAQTRISHAWGGSVAVTFDYLPHIGELDGVHYALGCNGSGITMMTYLGHLIAQNILEGAPHSRSAYGVTPPPTNPLYWGHPWFMPLVGTWYQMRDTLDRRAARTLPPNA